MRHKKQASRTSDGSREHHQDEAPGPATASQQLSSRQSHPHGRATGTLDHNEPRHAGSKGAAGSTSGLSEAMRPHQTPERARRGAKNASNWFSSPPRFSGAPALFQPSPGQHGASPAQQYLGNDLINLFQSPVRPVADAAALDLRLAETPGSTPLPASPSIFSPSPAPRSRGASAGRPRSRAVSLEAVGWDLRGQQQGGASSSLAGLPPGLLGPEAAEPGLQDMVSDLLRSPGAKDTPRRLTRSLAAAALAAAVSLPSGAGISTGVGGADASSLTPLVGKLQRRRCLDFSRAGGAGSSSGASRQVRAFKSEVAAATGPSAMISCQPTPLPLQQTQQQQQQQPAPASKALEAPTIDHLLLPEALAAAADVVAAGGAGQMDSPDAQGGLGPVLTLLGRGSCQQLMSPPQTTSTTRLAAGSSTLLTPISRRLQLPRHRGAAGGGAAAGEAEEGSPAGDDLDLLPLLPLQLGGSQQEGRLLEALSPGGDVLAGAEQQYGSRGGAQDPSPTVVSRVTRRGARKTRPPPQQPPVPDSHAGAVPSSAAAAERGFEGYDSDSHPVYNCAKGLRTRGRSHSGGAPDGGSGRVPLQQVQPPNSSQRTSRTRKRTLKYAAALLAEQGYVEEEQEGYDQELAAQCANAQKQQKQQQQHSDDDMCMTAAAAGAKLPDLEGDGQLQEAAAASDGDGAHMSRSGGSPWVGQKAVDQDRGDPASNGAAVSMALCSDWEEDEGEGGEQEEETGSQEGPEGPAATRSRSSSRARGKGRGRARGRSRTGGSCPRGTTQARAVQVVQMMPPRRSAAAGGGGRDASPEDDTPLAGLRPPFVEDLHVAVQQGRRSCRCKKSLCLKLYCECFAAGVYCFACSCRSCHNSVQHQAEVQEQRARIMLRDPDAFSTKLCPDQPSSRKGCNCRKSHCLKKYCDCFQMGVRCSGMCKCSACENTEELLGPSTGMAPPPSAPAPPPLAPAVELAHYTGPGGSDWGVAGLAGLTAVEAAEAEAALQASGLALPMMLPAAGTTPGAVPTPQVVDLGPALGTGPGANTARQQLFRRAGDLQGRGQSALGVVGNLADRFEAAVKQEPGVPVLSEQARAALAMSQGTARVLAAARELAPRLNRAAAGASKRSSSGGSKPAAPLTMGAPQLRHSSTGGGAAGGETATPTRLQTPDQQAPWPASCTPSAGSSCDGGAATTAAAAWGPGGPAAAGEGGGPGAARGRHRLSNSSSEGGAQMLQLAAPPEGAGLMPPPTGRPTAGRQQGADAVGSSKPGSGAGAGMTGLTGSAEQQQQQQQQQQQHDVAGASLMECDETVPAEVDPAAGVPAPAAMSSQGVALLQRLTPLKRKLEADGEAPGTSAAAASVTAQLDASMLQDMRLVYIADTQCLALVPAAALQGVLGTPGTATLPLPTGTPGVRTPGSSTLPSWAGSLAAARAAAAGDARVVYNGQLLGAAAAAAATPGGVTGAVGRTEAVMPHTQQQQGIGWVQPKIEPGTTPQHLQRQQSDQSQPRSLSSSTPPAAAAPPGRLLHCSSSLTPTPVPDATPPQQYVPASAGRLLGSGPSLPLLMQQVCSPVLGPGPGQLPKAGPTKQGLASPPAAGLSSAQQMLSPNPGQLLSPSGSQVVSPTSGRLLFRFSPGPTRLTPVEQA